VTRLSRHWFFSADPTRYHWDTLFVKGKDLWSDIRDSASQRYLKQVRKGDRVICYHGAPDRMVYALATVASDPYPDPRDLKKRLLIVDLKANERLPRPVPLKEMKGDRALRRMKFLARPRLAVSPLSEHEYNEVLRLAGVLISPYR
jgi:predicted RNA-binding protein with PUA-like domain